MLPDADLDLDPATTVVRPEWGYRLGSLACVAVALVGMLHPPLLVAGGMLVILGNATLAFAISFAMPTWRDRPEL